MQQKEMLIKLGQVQSEYQERRQQTAAQLKELKPPMLTEAEALTVREALEDLVEEESRRMKEVTVVTACNRCNGCNEDLGEEESRDAGRRCIAGRTDGRW